MSTLYGCGQDLSFTAVSALSYRPRPGPASVHKGYIGMPLALALAFTTSRRAAGIRICKAASFGLSQSASARTHRNPGQTGPVPGKLRPLH